MIVYKKIFLFFLISQLLFSLSTEYNADSSFTIYEGTNTPLYYFSTDFILKTFGDVYKTQNLKIFLPKTITDKVTSKEIFMCPGALDVSINSYGTFHHSDFSLAGAYYMAHPNNPSFACDCSDNVNACRTVSCPWPTDETVPPYGIAFSSESFFKSLMGGRDFIDKNDNRFSAFNSPSILDYKKENATKFYPFIGSGVFYQNHRTYATLLLKGTQSIFVKSKNNLQSYDKSFVVTQNLVDTNSETFKETINFINNQEDTFFKGVNYKGQIYKLFVGSKQPQFSDITLAYFPLPIDKDFSGVYFFKPNNTMKINFNQKSKDELTIYVVEPKECDQIQVDVSPSNLVNLQLNKPFNIKFIVSTPYELFGMKAKNIKVTSPNNWKIEKINGFDVSFSNSNPHILEANLIPTSVLAKKSKVCFEIEFEADTKFCDGSVCSTKKQICVDYEPIFYCILNTDSKLPLKSGDFANIFATCYLDNNPIDCPALTWTASNFNKPPSKTDRISLATPPYPNTKKPNKFAAVENNIMYTINPKVVKTMPKVLPQKQEVTLFTYSDQEASYYNLGSGTPKTIGKVVANGATDDNEEFSCSIFLDVNPSNLPDLIPVVRTKTIFSPNSQLPSYEVEWGVKYQGQLKIKSPDSPLETNTNIIADDITTPFNVSLYFLTRSGGPLASIKNITINSIKEGETIWVNHKFTYECSNPILTYVKIVADGENIIKERNEFNNEEISYLNCLYKLTCPGFV